MKKIIRRVFTKYDSPPNIIIKNEVDVSSTSSYKAVEYTCVSVIPILNDCYYAYYIRTPDLIQDNNI
jgi:hypothetical protein